MLQEFDLEIRDKKCADNLVADHLSRLENSAGDKFDGLINDNFPDEYILAVSHAITPWHADFVNYIVV